MGLSLVGFGSLVGGGVVGEVSEESVEVSVSFVGNAGLVVLGEPLEGGVSTDFNTFGFVGCGVEFGDDEIRNVLDLFGKFVPDGGEFLAVTAPGGVEFHKHVLGGVFHNICEVFSNQNVHTFLSFRNGLTLEERLELVVLEVAYKSTNGINGKSVEVSGELELLEVATGVDESDAREVALGDTDEFSES